MMKIVWVMKNVADEDLSDEPLSLAATGCSPLPGQYRN